MKKILFYIFVVLLAIVCFPFWLLHRIIVSPVAYYRFINWDDYTNMTHISQSHNI